jgi:uncharacterized protein (TIGR03435 family)
MNPAVFVALFACALHGQSFEAASIKPADPAARGSGINVQPARIRVMNATLKFCVQVAYDVKDFQVSGATGWMDADRFDIDAVAVKPFEKDEWRAMLKTLLTERFGVAAHIETKERQGYALVVAKNGPKLPKPEDDRSIMFSRTPSGDISLSAKNVTMSQLANALSSNLEKIVVDDTGLEGKFNASFQFAPDPALRNATMKNGEPVPPPPADAVPGPSVFTAVQELGLKLESRKVPVETIVIDRAEHPTGN